MFLQRRCRRPEIMDQPGLALDRHRHALRGLARINYFSRSAGILWPALRRLATEVSSRPLRVLDLAAGGGDVPIRLWRRAHRAGIPLHVEGCDVSQHAVDHAMAAAAATQADVRFFVHNVLSEPLPTNFDVLTCSLFLHHLDEKEACGLLRNMARSARRMVLINDLNRSLTGFLLAHVATRLLTLSDVVHTDGPLSVQAAFSTREARELAEKAGLTGAVIARRWPCRWLLIWRRP